MSADVRLLLLERGEEERLVVAWREIQGGDHGVELAVERRTAEGWLLHKRIVVALGEIDALGEALARASALARAVGR